MPNQITYNKTLTALLIASLFSGCSGSSNSDHSSSTNVQMSGAVVDDYVAYARVYVDINQNGKFDPSFEPYAYTDGSGYFSQSKEGKNYCADPKSSEYKFCLNVNDIWQKGTVIRVENGRDLLTALEYQSSMSLLTDGSRSGLKITAVSSINQAESQLNALQTLIKNQQLNLIGSTVDKDFKSFLNAYLQPSAQSSALRDTANSQPSINPNKIDPFQGDKSFKLAVNTHKMVETIASFLVKYEINFKANNFLNRKEGEALQKKDIVPFIYMAFYLNMDFSRQNTTLSDINNTLADKILSDTESLLSLVATLPRDNNGQIIINHPQIINTLASLYTFLDGLTVNTDDPRKTLVKAEIVTQAIKKEITQSNIDQPNPTPLNIDVDKFETIVNNSETQTENYQQLDFETAVDQVIEANSDTVQITASGKDFTPLLTAIIDDRKYFDLSADAANTATSEDNSNVTAFAIYFKQTSPVENAEEKSGDMIVCMQSQKENEPPKNNLFKGNWSWSANKSYALIAQYLGLSITLKNLDPTLSSNQAEDKCGSSARSCLSVTYPNISPDNPDASQFDQFLTKYFHDDNVDWNTHVNDSSLLKPIPNGYPQTADQCFM